MGQSGGIWVATGNGTPSATFDGSDAIVHLTSSRQMIATFAPPDWAADDAADHGDVVYVRCHNGVAAVAVDAAVSAARASAHILWRGPARANGSPILAGGLVWVVGTAPGEPYGLDPATVGVRAEVAVGATEHVASPAFAQRGHFAAAAAAAAGAEVVALG